MSTSKHMKTKQPCINLETLTPTIDEDNEVVEIVNQGENILVDYERLKMHYNILNKDRNLVITSNDEPTPIDCVEEMVNTIPDEFWRRRDIKILDPCCGYGNFFAVIVQKLKQYHTLSYILEHMLYFNDISIERISIVNRIFGVDDLKLNITTQDYLTYDNEMKYDLIVANPPYAKIMSNGRRASKNHNLIGIFITKTLELLKDRGYMLFITPDNWMSLSARNVLIERLTSLQIHHLNIHTAKKYFPKIGSSFVWYLIENTPFYKDIVVEGKFKKHIYRDIVPSQIRKYIPLYYNNIIKNIIDKTLDLDNQKFNIETSSDLHAYTKKNFLSKDRNNQYTHKIIHTPSQTLWSMRKHKYQDGYKVFISLTSTYDTFVDACGMTQSIAFIRVNSYEEATLICNILKHPLYRLLNNICRYGNFNNVKILQKFPYHDNYDTIYEKFNITQEEIRFIEGSLSI